MCNVARLTSPLNQFGGIKFNFAVCRSMKVRFTKPSKKPGGKLPLCTGALRANLWRFVSPPKVSCATGPSIPPPLALIVSWFRLLRFSRNLDGKPFSRKQYTTLRSVTQWRFGVNISRDSLVLELMQYSLMYVPLFEDGPFSPLKACGERKIKYGILYIY